MRQSKPLEIQCYVFNHYMNFYWAPTMFRVLFQAWERLHLFWSSNWEKILNDHKYLKTFTLLVPQEKLSKAERKQLTGKLDECTTQRSGGGHCGQDQGCHVWPWDHTTLSQVRGEVKTGSHKARVWREVKGRKTIKLDLQHAEFLSNSFSHKAVQSSSLWRSKPVMYGWVWEGLGNGAGTFICLWDIMCSPGDFYHMTLPSHGHHYE